MDNKMSYDELENLAINLYKQLKTLKTMKSFVTDNGLQGELLQYLDDNISMGESVPESMQLLLETGKWEFKTTI